MGGLVAAKGIEQILGCLMKGIRENGRIHMVRAPNFTWIMVNFSLLGLCIYLAMQVSQ